MLKMDQYLILLGSQPYYWLIYFIQLATNKSHDNPIQIRFTKSGAMLL